MKSDQVGPLERTLSFTVRSAHNKIDIVNGQALLRLLELQIN